MKILLVYLFLFFVVLALDITLDLLQGMKLSTSIHIITKTFVATTGTEKVLIAVSLTAPVLPVLFSLRKNKKRKSAGRG